MQVRAEKDRCVAAGMCAFSAPEVFDQSDEDGEVIVLQENPPEDQHEAVREAVHGCPAEVLSITE